MAAMAGVLLDHVDEHRAQLDAAIGLSPAGTSNSLDTGPCAEAGRRRPSLGAGRDDRPQLALVHRLGDRPVHAISTVETPRSLISDTGRQHSCSGRES